MLDEFEIPYQTDLDYIKEKLHENNINVLYLILIYLFHKGGYIIFFKKNIYLKIDRKANNNKSKSKLK